MIIDSDGHKLTPTKVAKAAIEHHAYMAVEQPIDSIGHLIDIAKLSDGDRRRIYEAVTKQYDRVRKLMGMAPL